MAILSHHGRFVKGVWLFLRLLLSYRLLAFRNLFSKPSEKRARLSRLHRRNAHMLREKMIELKGVFIKIGQFLSSRVDILPEEYTDELSKLQDQVPPTPFSEIARRVTEELGPMEEIFSSFEPVPIASASLGQVHKACLKDGDCIVVKVQYPGIEDIIAADIRTLNFIINILKRLYPHINLDVIYSEFSRIVRQELDYILEGKNAEIFGRNFAKNPRVKIPLVYWPYTTSKVLTLEYLEGIKITDFDQIDAHKIDKKETARILAEAYSQMFFVDGIFHGDPHPGNIFVREGPEIILVDFGMVDRISRPMREGLKRAFTAVVERDSLAVVRALVDMGFIPLTKDIKPLVLFVEHLFEKYRDLSPKEFKSLNIQEIGKDIQRAIQLNPSIQIPNDFILFGRVVGMLNGLGSRLDPDTNIIEIAAPFAKKFIQQDGQTAASLLSRAASTGRELLTVPRLLSEFLVTAGRGEARVEITSEDIVGELRKISRLGRGFILAIMTTGIGLISALFYINGLREEGLSAAAISAAFGLWLALTLRKT